MSHSANEANSYCFHFFHRQRNAHHSRRGGESFQRSWCWRWRWTRRRRRRREGWWKRMESRCVTAALMTFVQEAFAAVSFGLRYVSNEHRPEIHCQRFWGVPWLQCKPCFVHLYQCACSPFALVVLHRTSTATTPRWTWRSRSASSIISRWSGLLRRH